MKIFKVKLLAFGCLALCLVITGAIFLTQVTSTSASGVLFKGTPKSWQPPSSVAPQDVQDTQNAAGTQVAAAFSRQAGTPKKAITTIPFWSSAFTYQGTKYPYTMVGTDPSKGSATTQIPVQIIPIKLVLSNNVVFDGSTKAASTIKSPIFQSAKFSSGTTQYADAIQRAEFWQAVSKTSPNYHVLLGKPQQLATVTLNVPANLGQVVHATTGKTAALVDLDWFDTQLQKLLTANKVSPKTLPIFLTTNTFLAPQADINQCCIGGYHNEIENKSTNQIFTYAYATYNDPGFFTDTTFQDINSLSHELSEWMNDPFGTNMAPAWTIGSQSFYGCSTDFEVGDPLVGVNFTVNGYHLQDEAFLAWFARQAKSTSINGRYTYLGTFKTFSTACTVATPPPTPAVTADPITPTPTPIVTADPLTPTATPVKSHW